MVFLAVPGIGSGAFNILFDFSLKLAEVSGAKLFFANALGFKAAGGFYSPLLIGMAFRMVVLVVCMLGLRVPAG